MNSEIIRARIPADLKIDFEKIATRRGKTVSLTLRNLMIEYVEREKKADQMRQETLEAIEDVESGRIVNGDIIIDWLDSWGTDHELNPPEV